MTPKSEDEHHWQCLEDVSLAEFLAVSPFARYENIVKLRIGKTTCMYAMQQCVCVCCNLSTSSMTEV